MMEDLNDFIPGSSGWVLTTANAINDGGRIAGAGGRYGQPQYRGFVLQPVFPWDQLTKFPKPVWSAWLRPHARPTLPEPQPSPTDRGADRWLAILLAQPGSPRVRDAMVALAASEVASSLGDDGDRAAVQTAALEAAARAIDRMLCDLRVETGRPEPQ